MSTGCGWRMASSPAVSFLPAFAQNDRVWAVSGAVTTGLVWVYFFSPARRETGASLILFCFSFHSLLFFFLVWIFPSLPVSLFSSAVSAAVLVMSTDPSGCCTLQFLELHLFIFVLRTKMVKIA